MFYLTVGLMNGYLIKGFKSGNQFASLGNK